MRVVAAYERCSPWFEKALCVRLCVGNEFLSSEVLTCGS